MTWWKGTHQMMRGNTSHYSTVSYFLMTQCNCDGPVFKREKKDISATDAPSHYLVMSLRACVYTEHRLALRECVYRSTVYSISNTACVLYTEDTTIYRIQSASWEQQAVPL